MTYIVGDEKLILSAAAKVHEQVDYMVYAVLLMIFLQGS
jgi:hypothetical protein